VCETCAVYDVGKYRLLKCDYCVDVIKYLAYHTPRAANDILTTARTTRRTRQKENDEILVQRKSIGIFENEIIKRSELKSKPQPLKIRRTKPVYSKPKNFNSVHPAPGHIHFQTPFVERDGDGVRVLVWVMADRKSFPVANCCRLKST